MSLNQNEQPRRDGFLQRLLDARAAIAVAVQQPPHQVPPNDGDQPANPDEQRRALIDRLIEDRFGNDHQRPNGRL